MIDNKKLRNDTVKYPNLISNTKDGNNDNFVNHSFSKDINNLKILSFTHSSFISFHPKKKKKKNLYTIELVL